MVNFPVRRPPVRLRVAGGPRGVAHSCSYTFSGPRRRPRTCPLPLGSPRLPAVGSGAYGEMEDTLGGKQRFKGPASSQAPLAFKGPQGRGETGS